MEKNFKLELMRVEVEGDFGRTCRAGNVNYLLPFTITRPMKRHGDIFKEIVSFENLYLASRKGRRGKRSKASVLTFESEVEREIIKLQEELLSKTYRPGGYREFTIYERKPRKISAAPYRDRVVHHSVV